jgi:uncharacterized membrane protein YgcG
MKNSATSSVQITGKHIERKNKLAIKLSVIVLLIMGIFAYNNKAEAQINNSVSSQCLWGPVGYDYVDYYYFPQSNVYYYVPTSQFIYLNGPNWVFVNNLPPDYNMNLYNTYKVVINEPNPYLRNDVYRIKYAQYKNGGPRQTVIRDSRDSKYYVVKGHPGNDHEKGNNNSNGNNGNRNNNNNNNRGQSGNNHKEEGNQQQGNDGGGGHRGNGGDGNRGGRNGGDGGNGGGHKNH